MKKVAITGDIASGKSTACRHFEELGAHIADADQIVHQLLDPSSPFGKRIVEMLGEDVIVDGVISREAIAKKVFTHAKVLKELESLIHPEVKKMLQEEIDRAEHSGRAPIFVAEVPLLFESGLQDLFEEVIVMTAPEESSVKWFQEKTGQEPKEFYRRRLNMMPTPLKLKRAKYTLTNEGSFEDLRKQVENLFNTLTS